MAPTRQELQGGFRLGECLVEPRHNRIVRAGAEAHLEPRVMDVLVCLAEHGGEVVSRETLAAQVWGSVIVTDQALTNCISELRHHLDNRAAIETIPKRGYRLTLPVTPNPPIASTTQAAATHKRRAWPLAAGLALLLAAAVAWWWRSEPSPALTSVAVLPFENAAGDANLDYLSLALPDEIATLLTESRDLAVRPSRYLDGDDPLAAARARRVDHIVTGRYYLEEGEQLALAVEAQQVEQERVIWRARVTAPARDLLAMRARIVASVQQGLLPALATRTSASGHSTPAHDEAYQLYLRSLALPKQPKPTERAIEMLERAVELDPQFAPAWQALGVRYYDHVSYGPGADFARQRSLAAHRRALELDPGLIAAARNIGTHHTEAGDLAAAYRLARRLLEQFGSNAETHGALAYVYRYGGLQEEAQRHCELALERDPHEPRLRSCAYAYLYDGDLSQVMRFLSLDEGSYFVQWGTTLYQLRRKDATAALHAVRQTAADPTRGLMEPCLEGKRGAEVEGPVAEFIRYWERVDDPESAYAVAPILLWCDRPQAALGFVERAVDTGFCSYPALDRDPVWAAVRTDPEFARIRAKAAACHEQFRRMTAEASPR